MVVEVGEKVKGAACVDKRKHSVCTTLLSRAGRECAPGRGRKGLVYQAKECRLGYRKGNREPLNQFKERKDMVRLCLKSHSGCHVDSRLNVDEIRGCYQDSDER